MPVCPCGILSLMCNITLFRSAVSRSAHVLTTRLSGSPAGATEVRLEACSHDGRLLCMLGRDIRLHGRLPSAIKKAPAKQFADSLAA